MKTFNQFIEEQMTNEGLGTFLGNALQKAGSFLSGNQEKNVEQKIKQYEDAIRNATKTFKDPYLQELIELRLKSFAKDYASVMKNRLKQQPQQAQPQQNPQQPQQPAKPQAKPVPPKAPQRPQPEGSKINISNILGR